MLQEALTHTPATVQLPYQIISSSLSIIEEGFIEGRFTAQEPDWLDRDTRAGP